LSAKSDGDLRHGQRTDGTERLFVAWAPDGATRDALADVAASWRAREPDRGLHWQHRDQAHMTLRFLGATRPAQRACLLAGLGALAAGRGPARAQAAALEAWPSPRRPRVLVLELRPDPALVELAGALETLARACGFAPEYRAFRPHFTLARAHEGSALRDVPPAAPPMVCRIDALTLVRSSLTAAGARHAAIATAPLRAP
jgi:RNA 2',3'-cyclic 3'-phosphodiesterase